MHRRYNRWWARFEQPDPYDGGYNVSDPQSFNRYSYVKNDPVNFVDPSGLDPEDPEQCNPGDICYIFPPADGSGRFGGGGSEDTGMVIETGPQNPVPTGELERIRGDVEKSIAKCAGFLKALLDEAAVQTGQPYRDIMVTFDNIKFLYGTPGPGHGGEATGSFERGNATALIREFKEPFVSTDRSAFIRTQTAQNFLGETFHHVGTNSAYRDAPLANALNRVLFRQGKEPLRQFFERTSAQINAASFYLHDRIFTACQVRY